MTFYCLTQVEVGWPGEGGYGLGQRLEAIIGTWNQHWKFTYFAYIFNQA